MAPPAIPSAFMATIVSNTTGTVPGIPKGVEEFSQFYDYTNKRLRKDMSNGYTKVYRYDVKEEPACAQAPTPQCLPWSHPVA